MDPELAILTGPLLALLGIARRLGGSRPQAGRSAAGAVTSITAPVGRVSHRLPGPFGGIVAITVGLTEIVVGTGAGLIADGADLVVAPVVGLAGRRSGSRARSAAPSVGYGRSAVAQHETSGATRAEANATQAHSVPTAPKAPAVRKAIASRTKKATEATKAPALRKVAKAPKVAKATKAPKPTRAAKATGKSVTSARS